MLSRLHVCPAETRRRLFDAKTRCYVCMVCDTCEVEKRAIHSRPPSRRNRPWPPAEKIVLTTDGGR